MRFTTGQVVVHPHHGPATVTGTFSRTVRGEEMHYLQLVVTHNALELALPVAKADASKLMPYHANTVNAVPQIASCVNATSETPTSLPIIRVNGDADEKSISAIRVSFSSTTAPMIAWP